MRAKKADANQREIFSALRKANISYFDTSSLGRGFPDLTVGYEGHTYLFEIKNPDVNWSLTDPEKKFAQTWDGHYQIVTNVDDIFDHIGYTK